MPTGKPCQKQTKSPEKSRCTDKFLSFFTNCQSKDKDGKIVKGNQKGTCLRKREIYVAEKKKQEDKNKKWEDNDTSQLRLKVYIKLDKNSGVLPKVIKTISSDYNDSFHQGNQKKEEDEVSNDNTISPSGVHSTAQRGEKLEENLSDKNTKTSNRTKGKNNGKRTPKLEDSNVPSTENNDKNNDDHDKRTTNKESHSDAKIITTPNTNEQSSRELNTVNKNSTEQISDKEEKGALPKSKMNVKFQSKESLNVNEPQKPASEELPSDKNRNEKQDSNTTERHSEGKRHSQGRRLPSKIPIKKKRIL